MGRGPRPSRRRRRALADVVARVARVGAGAAVEGRADGEAPAVRAQRADPPGLVLRCAVTSMSLETIPGAVKMSAACS